MMETNSTPVAGYLAMLYFGSEFLLGLARRAKGGSSSPADRGSTRVLWLTIMPSMFLGFWCQFGVPQARWEFQPWINVIGIAIVILGLVIRWYSIIYLGRFFTVNVAIAADHQLIDSGPYRRVRHPSYTGALMAFWGLALCTQNWVSLILIGVGPTVAFLYRMHVEEIALSDAFGERYRQYVQRTARLIPGVY
ncbi:MAG TPA: isoprenylcysteine carboxylmethyltransferase family protein [Steroidobacteraceae bacterium]|jgi:protein-S-isoprenylcysteine O-methyltransferase|nr:isoprenylcysteine carboxylmethyltransferase family protein [Steroidobacteraceae bacterium]